MVIEKREREIVALNVRERGRGREGKRRTIKTIKKREGIEKKERVRMERRDSESKEWRLEREKEKEREMERTRG